MGPCLGALLSLPLANLVKVEKKKEDKKKVEKKKADKKKKTE